MSERNWTCYREAIDESMWDIDSGTTHAPGRYGRTLCGTKIGKHTHQGGNWEDDWQDVTCQRCLRKMGAR